MSNSIKNIFAHKSFCICATVFTWWILRNESAAFIILKSFCSSSYRFTLRVSVFLSSSQQNSLSNFSFFVTQKYKLYFFLWWVRLSTSMYILRTIYTSFFIKCLYVSTQWLFSLIGNLYFKNQLYVMCCKYFYSLCCLSLNIFCRAIYYFSKF